MHRTRVIVAGICLLAGTATASSAVPAQVPPQWVPTTTSSGSSPSTAIFADGSAFVLYHHVSVIDGTYTATLLRSHDYGRDWEQLPVPSQPTGSYAATLAMVSPRHGFYFKQYDDNAAGGLLWVTDDGATTWRRVTTRLVHGPAVELIDAPALVAAASGIVAVGTWSGRSCSMQQWPEIHVSRDDGRTWRATTLRVPGAASAIVTGSHGEIAVRVFHLAFADAEGGGLFCTIGGSEEWWTSVDGGARFTRAVGCTYCQAVAYPSRRHAVAFESSDRGGQHCEVLLSDDGVRFTRRVRLTVVPGTDIGCYVDAIGFDGRDRGFAATGQGMFATTDGGRTWQHETSVFDVAPPSQQASLATDGVHAIMADGGLIYVRESV